MSKKEEEIKEENVWYTYDAYLWYEGWKMYAWYYTGDELEEKIKQYIKKEEETDE